MASEEIVRRLADDLKPVKPLRAVAWRILLWTGFAVSCVAAGVWAFGARADLAVKLGEVAYLCRSALLLLVFVLSARSAFHLGIPGAAGTRAPPIVGLLVWVFLLAAVQPPETGDPASAAPGWPCVFRMTCLAFPPALAALVMLRRAAPLSPRWTGWFALLSAASLAVVGTQVICAKDEARHLFLWHFGPLLGAALFGVHLGRWFLRRAWPTTMSAGHSSSPVQVAAGSTHAPSMPP